MKSNGPRWMIGWVVMALGACATSGEAPAHEGQADPSIRADGALPLDRDASPAAPGDPIDREDAAVGPSTDAGEDATSDAGEPPRRGGDPELGRALLLNNGSEDAPYLSCGVPKSLIDLVSAGGLLDIWGDAPRLPERERGNDELPYNFSYATTARGVQIVTTNCLLCHASRLGDSLIIGLGNPNLDFSGGGGLFGLSADVIEAFAALALSEDERVELGRFNRVLAAAAEATRTDTVGQNPADVMFAVLAAHRDPATLQWLEEPDPAGQLAPEDRVFIDVPPWWHSHQRAWSFYSGYGRPDHARSMMTASLMCLEDIAEAEAIDAYFGHIEAFIRSLRPPAYEDVSGIAIDSASAARGRGHYEALCVTCHGDSERGLAPVPLVDAAIVGTDPKYAQTFTPGDVSSYFIEFFNSSWYGQSGSAGLLQPPETPSYAPPPLAGVWATAPYFHNGSVPTLDAVLDPSLRPAIFRRSIDPETYDFERCGWPYEEVPAKGQDTTVYDATREGDSNRGHAFAAALTPEERADLLEYLKTL